MADLLRPGDHGLVGGGPGPDGQPDARVAKVPAYVPTPPSVVLGQDMRGKGSQGLGT